MSKQHRAYIYITLLQEIILVHIRNNLLLLTIALYLIFIYGFMQVRIPPVKGSGVPVGEIVLLLSFLTFSIPAVFLRLSKTLFLAPFIIWWSLGIVRALMGIPEHGMWALRDATHVIESLFLVVGFVFAGRISYMERFFRWLPKILVICGVYVLAFPFANILQGLSPKIVAGSGREVALFFNFINCNMITLMLIGYLLLFRRRTSIGNTATSLLAIFFLTYSVFLFQARTVYLQIIALSIVLMFFRPRLFGKWIIGLIVLLDVLLLVSIIELPIKGRLGQAVSIEFLINHLMAIAGVAAKGVEGAAGGVWQRFEWWLNLYNQWTSSLVNFFFGLGYGAPLIDFSAFGVAIREPHNSYISILARIGLVGAAAWIWMHVLLLAVWRRAYASCRLMQWDEGKNRLLLLMIFFVLIWVLCIGEDGLEKPFNAIPYYFFWGIVVRFASHLKEGLLGPPLHNHENPRNP
jgi:hypothetical protein